MGLIQCIDHKDQGVVHLCQHAYGDYLRGQVDRSAYRMMRDVTRLSVYLCDECVCKFTLEECDVLGLDEIERIGDQLAAVCGKCFERGHPPDAEHDGDSTNGS